MNPRLLESEDVAWFREEPATARGAVSALGRRVGLDPARTSEVALAVTELATNLRKHAVDGSILLRVVRTGLEAGVEVVAVDHGPGMADVADSLRDGVSSTGTLGIGLGAVVRLADVFDVHSIPARGTVLAARFWPRRPDAVAAARPDPGVAGLTRAIVGEAECGDAWAVRSDGDGAGSAVLVLLADGLGHGPLAALASGAAVRAFQDGPAGHPEEVMTRIHTALRGTRGAAAAVARIEPAEGRVLYCGVGNIAAALVNLDGRSGLLSHPGIVGHQMRRLRTFEYPLPADGALVMHSDGLTERWSVEALPGLLRHTPIVIAGQLLREAGVRRDDAGVVVAKGLW